MSSKRKPALPPAIEARVAKKVFMTIAARKGERAVDRFVKAVRAGGTPDRKDMQIVAAQLEQALADVRCRRAFGLQDGQGRKEDPGIRRRNQLICAEVDELRAVDYTLAGAAELVGLRYNLEPETVSKLHKSANKRRRDHSEFLEHVEKRGKN